MKGIIVSIQGYSKITTEELCQEAVNAGACCIKTDKTFNAMLKLGVPIIGCHKLKVDNPEKEAYLTSNIDLIKEVNQWADFVSIDYRKLNKNLPEISEYCKQHKIKVIADIGTMEDYRHIKEKGLYFTYLATTFSVFEKRFYPDLKLAKELINVEKNVIAEGNFKTRDEVKQAFELNIPLVCIGTAISSVYKLTRKFTTLLLK